MAKSLSPLRYPGGKSKIYHKVRNLIEINGLSDRTYVEPFAGGFGIGIGLLCDEIVSTAILNDYDSHIYHFWYSVLYQTDDLLKRIADTPITLEEREKQKAIYKDCSSDSISDGFATFFLNRVNFSGIIMGGPLGGFAQSGEYKINCRFNKYEISNRIEKIAMMKDKIELFNCDASELITKCLQDKMRTSFFNIDPPYVKKGQQLYANYFKEIDHRNFEQIISNHLGETRWILTYDDCDLIREIYKEYYMQEYLIQHNAGNSVYGKEIVVTNLPIESFVW